MIFLCNNAEKLSVKVTNGGIKRKECFFLLSSLLICLSNLNISIRNEYDIYVCS